MRVRWGRILSAFLVIWILILLYFLMPLWRWTPDHEQIAQKLQASKEEISRLSEENVELRTLLKRLQQGQSENSKDEAAAAEKPQLLENQVAKFVKGPSKDYEMTRRQTVRDVNEMWWYIRSRIEHAQSKYGTVNPDLSTWLNQTLKDCQHHQKSVLVDLEHLGKHEVVVFCNFCYFFSKFLFS